MSTAEPDSNAGPGGAAIEDKLEARNLMIAESQWEHLRRLSYEQNRSISEIVREAIGAHVGEAA